MYYVTLPGGQVVGVEDPNLPGYGIQPPRAIGPAGYIPYPATTYVQTPAATQPSPGGAGQVIVPAGPAPVGPGQPGVNLPQLWPAIQPGMSRDMVLAELARFRALYKPWAYGITGTVPKAGTLTDQFTTNDDSYYMATQLVGYLNAGAGLVPSLEVTVLDTSGGYPLANIALQHTLLLSTAQAPNWLSVAWAIPRNTTVKVTFTELGIAATKYYVAFLGFKVLGDWR